MYIMVDRMEIYSLNLHNITSDDAYLKNNKTLNYLPNI